MTEEELRDLAERTQQIGELANSIGWDLFVDRAHAEITKKQKAILSGNMDAEQYRRDTGWVAGALAMLSLPTQAREEYARARQQYEEARQAAAGDEVEGVSV